MKNKTCELDTIPTNLPKEILLIVLETSTITQLVNMLLATGTFPIDWKKAIIRRLIKQARLELIKTNLQTCIKSLFSIQADIALYIKTITQKLQMTTAYYHIFNQHIMQIIAEKPVFQG